MVQYHLCKSVSVGAVGGTFAVGACFAAKLRDRDDYVNAVIGGMLAGSIFGYKSRFLVMLKPSTYMYQ